MAEHVPTIHVTHSSKRRAEAAPSDPDEVCTPATKKRVVLGELKSLTNVDGLETKRGNAVAQKKKKVKVGKRRKDSAGTEEVNGAAAVVTMVDNLGIDVERPLPDYIEKIISRRSQLVLSEAMGVFQNFMHRSPSPPPDASKKRMVPLVMNILFGGGDCSKAPEVRPNGEGSP